MREPASSGRSSSRILEDAQKVLKDAQQEVEDRHASSWGRTKGRAAKLWFGEGTTTTKTEKVKDLVSGQVGGAYTRNRKKRQYLELNVSGLDSGLHEFIRSAARHYYRAKKAAPKIRELKPADPQAGELPSSDLVAIYAQFRHDLAKSRRYLNACTKLTVECYKRMGLSRDDVDAGLLGRGRNALRTLVHGQAIDGIPSGQDAAIEEARRLRSELESVPVPWAETTPWKFLGADPETKMDFKKKMAHLENPGRARQVWRHYKRRRGEADRKEKGSYVVEVVFGTVGNLPPLRPFKFLLKQGSKRLFLKLATEKWVGTADPTQLLKLDEVQSADTLEHKDLQSLAHAVDKLIVATARHLQRAEQQLDALEAAPRATATSLGSYLTTRSPEDEDGANEATPHDASKPTPVDRDRAILYYEYAHDFGKALDYWRLVAIFEFSLTKALKEIEQLEKDGFPEQHGL